MKYCEIQETPEFQFTVDNLRDTFGTDAEHIAYKSYLENNKTFIKPDEIIAEESSEYFSPARVKTRSSLSDAIANDIMFNSPAIERTQPNLYTIKIAEGSKKITKDEQRYKVAEGLVDRINDIYGTPFDPVAFMDTDKGQVKIRMDIKQGHINKYERPVLSEATRFYRETNPQTALIMDLNNDNSGSMSSNSNDRVIGLEIVKQYAKGLSDSVGVDFDFLNFNEAYNILKDSKTPYQGEKAFFVGGKVYFVGENLNKDTLFHEFSHPLVRAISISNTKLFNKMYIDLAITSTGKQIIEDVINLYPEIEISSDLFKEEVIVRALTKAADLQKDGLKEVTSFKKFIKDLFYQIKQLLRTVFGGKIDVSKLNVDTSLAQLADMLKTGGKFDIDVNTVSDEDIAAYAREYKKHVDELIAKRLDVKEVEDLTNTYFELAKKQMRRLITANDYPALLEIMKNKYKKGELEKITQNLKPWQSKIIQDAIQMEDEMELTQRRATSVINSLNNLSTMMDKIYEGLQDIVKDVNSPENVRRIDYYQKSINYWEDFMRTASDVLEKEGIKIPAIDHINNIMRQSNRLVEKFYENAVGDIIYNELAAAGANIDNKWVERKKFLEEKGTPVALKQLESEKKLYDLQKITPEGIKAALKGNVKDMSFVGKWLEPYGYSPNPIVGGTSLFIKNSLGDVDALAQATVNTQSDELSPLLKDFGYNPNKAMNLGIDLGQKEKVGSINQETGDFEEIEEWRFQNEFTGSDLAKQQYQYKIRTASEKYQTTKNEKDKQLLADLQSEYDQFLLDYWHQEHAPEFYKMFEPFKRDAIGHKAQMALDELNAELDEIRNDYVSAEDEVEIGAQIETLRRKIKQLSSLTDEFGNKKTGDDLEIAKRIQEFNDSSRKFYDDPVEVPGAFETAYANYKQKLSDEGKTPGSFEYNELLDKWKENNTRIVIEDDFWITLNDVNDRIRTILETLPNDVAKKLEIEEAYQEIKSILTGNKDESGQPVGDEMKEESLRKIKAAQEKILAAQEFLNKISGLTRSEKLDLEIIYSKIADGTAVQGDYVNMNRLFDKQDVIGLDKIKRAALRGLYSKLDELRQREPTDAYINTVNSFLRGMENNPLIDKISSVDISKSTAYVILNDQILEQLFAESAEFEKWFRINHYRRLTLDQATGQEVEKWEKTYAWNVIRPKDPKYLKKTFLKDADGNIVEEIKGIPSMKYFKKLVKPEYKTEKIVGVTTDNSGRWLPRTMKQGAKDDRFLNKEYGRLKEQDPIKYKLLEKMKAVYLRNQETAHPEARLYYAYPRYQKQSLERLGSEKPVDRVVEKVKNFWQGVKDKWDTGLNFEADVQYTKMDLFDGETSGIPIAGLAKMNIEEVSTDILSGIMRYMYSSLRQNKLIEIAPTVKAVQQVVNDKKNFPFVEQAMGSRTAINMSKRKDKSVMAEAINNMVSKTFEGKNQVGWGSDVQWVQNLSNVVFKQASFAYLALNIPSGTKNMLSMKVQGTIEAAAGKHFSFKDYLSAEGVATSTTFQISGEIYKKGSKSLNVQLVELFDFERDRFKHGIGESLSRTPLKDTLKPLERMNDYRKWVQLQASLQTGFAMMKTIKVDQNGTQIPYLEAWEVKEGRLQLKEGIDPSWGISYREDGTQIVGEKFKQKRNEIHGVLDSLNGSMGADQRAEVERYLLGKYLMFFRRWMTRMFANRFAYSGSILNGTARGRLDPSLNDTKQGWYITNLQFLYKAFRSMGRYLPYATAEEKSAILRLTTEIGTLLLISALGPVLFNYDPDDEDRLKKLRAKSGALPLPGVVNDPNRPFEFGGYLSNHLLLLMLQVRGENDQFLPFPGLGLSSYKQYLDVQSIATGPTLKTYATIAQDLGYLVSGSDKAFYQKDVGAWGFQQAEEKKIWAHIAKAFGLSGTHVDPVTGLKNFENIQNR